MGTGCEWRQLATSSVLSSDSEYRRLLSGGRRVEHTTSVRHPPNFIVRPACSLTIYRHHLLWTNIYTIRSCILEGFTGLAL